MAGLTAAAVRFASTFSADDNTLSTGGKAGITAALLIITLLSNVCGVHVCMPHCNRNKRNTANFL
jgi:hypothetical protein